MQNRNNKPNRKRTIEKTKIAQTSALSLSKRVDDFIKLTKKMDKNPEKYSYEDRENVENLYNELMGRMAIEKKILDGVKADLLKLNALKKSL